MSIPDSRMVMKEITEIILSVVSTLEKNPFVAGVKLYQRQPISSTAIEDWEKINYPYTLPDDFKTFLQFSNGVLIKWNLKNHVNKTKEKETPSPVGYIQVNSLEYLKKVLLQNRPLDEDGSDVEDSNPIFKKAAFTLDSHPFISGRACLLYTTGYSHPQMWYQDLACDWHFIANNFMEYLRLMAKYLGIIHWQCAFTTVGLDPVTKQWMQLLCPEQLDKIQPTTAYIPSAQRPTSAKSMLKPER